ncbi:hypothetical protein [Ureibacillus massiliensis]|uniref:hypothetical protein n=1 Tax=Ureibacillus massiliensis TaxID=292806 RepID=UPI000B3243C0|nr:hypothetical protein [Ureibacillus massiliensis]
MMEQNEKAMRLQVMLDEAFKPVLAKIEALEKEVQSLQENQVKLLTMLAERE